MTIYRHNTFDLFHKRTFNLLTAVERFDSENEVVFTPRTFP